MSFWLFYVVCVCVFFFYNPDFFRNHNACFWKYSPWYALWKSTSLWISEVLTSSFNNTVPIRCNGNNHSSDIRRMDLINLCQSVGISWRERAVETDMPLLRSCCLLSVYSVHSKVLKMFAFELEKCSSGFCFSIPSSCGLSLQLLISRARNLLL